MANGYQIYRLLADDLTRVVSKEALRLPKGERNHAQALRYLYSINPQMIFTIDTQVLCDEWFWLHKAGRHVIFPQSAEVLSRLLDAKIDLQNTAPMVMPHQSFMLAVPRDFVFEGMRIPPVMVSTYTSEEQRQVVERFSKEVTGIQTDTQKVGRWYGDDIGIFTTFRINDYSTSGNDMTYRANFAQRMIPDILRSKDVHEYREILGSFEGKYFRGEDLTIDESRLQRAIIRLIAMLALYSHSYPDALHEGFPGKEPKHMEPRLHDPWKKQTITMPSASALPEHDRTYHYRSWHFRQLMSERFYKGEHAHRPVGSRIVFVRDSMVGRKAEAETFDDS